MTNSSTFIFYCYWTRPIDLQKCGSQIVFETREWGLRSLSMSKGRSSVVCQSFQINHSDETANNFCFTAPGSARDHYKVFVGTILDYFNAGATKRFVTPGYSGEVNT